MPDDDSPVSEGKLKASVAARDSGPVVVLSGDADLTSSAQLSALITAQLCQGTRQLTVDVSGLRFADTASIRTLVLAAKTLEERRGRLILLHPQRPVSRVLTILGVDYMFTIQRDSQDSQDSQDGQDGQDGQDSQDS